MHRIVVYLTLIIQSIVHCEAPDVASELDYDHANMFVFHGDREQFTITDDKFNKLADYDGIELFDVELEWGLADVRLIVK